MMNVKVIDNRVINRVINRDCSSFTADNQDNHNSDTSALTYLLTFMVYSARRFLKPCVFEPT
jgi:hypothetical protein